MMTYYDVRVLGVYFRVEHLKGEFYLMDLQHNLGQLSLGFRSLSISSY